MKENIMNEVVEGVKQRMTMLRGRLRDEFKNTKRFRQEPVSRNEMARHYRAMTPEIVLDLLSKQASFYQQRQQELLQQFPESKAELRPAEELAREDVNEFIWEMQKISKDRRLKREVPYA